MQKIFFPILILSFLIIGTGAFAQEINLPAVSGAELPAVSKIELSNSGLAPDSPFYFLDTLAEKISLLFTFDIVKKAEKAFQYAGEKLAEAKAMAGANKIEALKKAGQKYQEYLSLFFKKGEEAYEAGKDVKELEEASKWRSLDYLRVLSDTREEVLEEAKAEIEKIIKVSRESFGETIWSVHEERMKELREEKIEKEALETPEEEKEKKEEEIILEEELGPEEISNTTRAGKLERNEIWSGQIDITGDILVEEGVTLTIFPGTQVIISASEDIQNLFGHWGCDGIKDYDLLSGKKREKSESCGVHEGEPYRDEANHISIIIKGILKAIGTENNRVVFKSDSLNPTIYDWNRLEIHNGILSYANIENYRILETKGDDVEISHNNLKNIGECGICANSKSKILFNTISYAGHELIDMHNNSPIIRNNEIGPNPNRSCITIDGGLPQITGNIISGCGSGISLLKPPDDPTFEESVLQNNTFIGNGSNIWYTY